MNQIEVVIQWFVDDEITEQELIACLTNLNVSKLSIDRLAKRAVYEKSKYQARVEEERKNHNEANKEA